MTIASVTSAALVQSGGAVAQTHPDCQPAECRSQCGTDVERGRSERSTQGRCPVGECIDRPSPAVPPG